MKKILILSLFLIQSALAYPISEKLAQQAKVLSEGRYWHLLMHYKPGLISGVESQADGEMFFQHPDGKKEPYLEILENIKIFDQNIKIGHLKHHPQCVYPERYRYLKKELNLKIKDVHCKDFKWWKENIRYHSLTLVFSSYYANNPASIFGHTLLRVNSVKKDKRLHTIRDYGIDFSATTDTDSGLEFAIRGLLGGYPGLYAIKPYYMKLNEYTNYESRDLWEYDLNINPEQVSRMLSHLWEIAYTTYFDYFFMVQNCSYQLLTLLEVANPDLHLSDGFPIYALPADTVKRLTETPGAVTKVRFRPSYKKVLYKTVANLSDEQKNFYYQLMNLSADVKTITDPYVLEAAIAFFRYKRFEYKNVTDKEGMYLKKILLQRSTIKEKTKPLEFALEDQSHERPDLAHDGYRVELKAGDNSFKGKYEEFIFRSGLHDLLDEEVGYPPYSILEFLQLNARFDNETSDITLSEFKAFEILSLYPIRKKDFEPSWGVKLRAYRPEETGCYTCYSAQLQVGGGVSYLLFKDHLSFYSMLVANIEASTKFEHNWRAGPGIRVGANINFSKKWKLLTEYYHFYDVNQKSFEQSRYNLNTGLSYHFNKNQQVRGNYKLFNKQLNMDKIENFSLSFLQNF